MNWEDADDSDEIFLLFQELELLFQGGLTHLQVLQSATINTDNAFGKPENLIREKSEANFTILKNNPLEGLTVLKSVFGIVHGGHCIELK